MRLRYVLVSLGGASQLVCAEARTFHNSHFGQIDVPDCMDRRAQNAE